MSTTMRLIHPKSYLCTTVYTFVVISNYVPKFAARPHKPANSRQWSLHENFPFDPSVTSQVTTYIAIQHGCAYLRTCVFITFHQIKSDTSTGIDADASKGETLPGYFNSKLVYCYKCGILIAARTTALLHHRPVREGMLTGFPHSGTFFPWDFPGIFSYFPEGT